MNAAPAELPTFTVSGYCDSSYSERDRVPGRINSGLTIHDFVTQVIVRVEVETADQARAIAATFPKSWRVKAGQGGGINGPYGYVRMQVDFTADAVNGGANETGLKRLRAILKRVPWVHGAENVIGPASERQIRALLND